MAKRISYEVHGTVQGVFFRQSTQEQARSLGLTGFVSNDPAGHVAGEAQGDEGKLKDFVEFLKKGPRHAHVSEVKTGDLKPKDDERSFWVK